MITRRMRGKDFISIMDYNLEELETIFEVAQYLKMKWAIGEEHPLLKGKTLGMLFASPSTRTRISFETGMTQLGGHAQYYSPEQLQLKNKESWKDTAEMISRFIDGFAIRLYNLKAQMGAEKYDYGDAREVLCAIAKDASIPVLNMLDDKEHPCQIMADIMTMREKFGEDYKKKKVVMGWAWDDRAKSAGVPQTMVVAGGILGMNIVLAYPDETGCYDIDPEYLKFAQETAKESGGKITVEHDIWKACKGADVIYCKSWARKPDVHAEKGPQYAKDWCISHKHFKDANSRAVYMHCLPAKRGKEVTNELIDDPKVSIVNDEAENRLHVQKAIMALTM
ncbi:MAG: ornithine carbamoyltransferase [Candidatus Aureabacteria bacterium]|nr:ornithine carbamoyltransferase [Candidatus Auribacterota bacterium]